MNKIKYKYKYQFLLLIVMMGSLFGSIVNNETGWEYVQAVEQTFHILEFYIDGERAEGDGQIGSSDDSICLDNPGTCDVVGAFVLRDEDDFGDLNENGIIEPSIEVCVGWIYANNIVSSPLNDPDGLFLTTLGVMGNDSDIDWYLGTNEVPFLKIYDHEYGAILPLDLSNLEPGSEAYEIESGELGPFSNNNIFVYNGSAEAYNIPGCTDVNACNLDSDATANDGSCIYPPSGELSTSEVVDGNSFIFSFDEDDLEGSAPFYHQVIVTQGFTEIYNQIDAESPIILDNLEWSTTYSVEVITTNNSECESLPNAEYPFITYDNVQTDPMPTPSQVELSTVVPGEGQVYLEWDPVDYGSIYRIFSNEVLIDSVLYPIDETSYLDTELAPNSSYTYQIQAINLEYPEETSFGELSAPIDVTTSQLSNVELDSLITGQGQIQLSWSMENPQYAGESYSFDIYMDDQYLTSRFGSSYTVANLEPAQEYCFYIIAQMELPVDGELVNFIANQSEILCGVPDEISGWSILIEVENQVVTEEDGTEIFYDTYNEIGVNPDATDGYDAEFDYPEPPINPSPGAVSFSFYHSEWGMGDIWGNYFTSDIRSMKDLSKTIEKWEANTEFTTMQGTGSLSFDLISNAGGYPVFLNWTDQYFLVSDGGSVPFQYDEQNPSQFIGDLLNPNFSDNFNFIVGNQPPAIPLDLQVEGGDSREMNLAWDLSVGCSTGGISCNDYANRYPATSYKIYRSWYQESEPRLIGLAGTRHNRISILPSQLYAGSDDLFSIIDGPSDGFIQLEHFESYNDLNDNNVHDIGEDFIDCGWDGICPGDPGYQSEQFFDLNGNNQYDPGEEFEDSNSNGIWDENGPDIGEEDGVCNVVYFYQANGYLTEGIDSLTYSNSIYDYGEDYIDENENNQWDEGESYTDSRKLMIRISDSLESEYSDAGLRTGTIYFYNVLASNDAGNSDLSVMDSGETAPNIRPIADAGLDQKRYLTSINDDSIMCTFPLDNVDSDDDGYPDYDLNGNEILDAINNSYDPDGLETEELNYFWELYDPDNSLEFAPQESSGFGDVGWWRIGSEEVLDIALPESDYYPDENYLVRLYVQDISEYYSIPDSITIEVTRDIPVPAMVTNLTANQNLYYVELEWDESEYDLPGGVNPAPEGYDGNLDIADFYEIYRDSVLHHTLAADSEMMSFADVGLTPSEEYCYYIVATNEAGGSIPSNENCYTTGNLPIPSITSLSGGEIYLSGETVNISWISAVDETPLSESEYISRLEVLRSEDGGVNWEIIEGASWVQSEIPNNFQWTVPEVNKISFDNKFKVKVVDIGDFGGSNSVSHEDISDHLIVIANNKIENTFEPYFNLISSPLSLYEIDPDSSFSNNNYDLFSYPETQDVEFQASNGFYLAFDVDSMNLSVEGEALRDEQIVELTAGWNLIGHPSVAKVDVNHLEVRYPDDPSSTMSWEVASNAGSGIVQPSIQGFNHAETRHEPVNRLEPFQGYWIHASTPLELIVTPHILDDDESGDDQNFLISLFSEQSEADPALLMKDMIEIGLSSDASNDMGYGEDEYDFPIIATPANYANMWIDQPDWYESGVAEQREFYKDVKNIVGDRKSWTIKGDISGTSSGAPIHLSWEIKNIDQIGEKQINLIYGQEVYDIKENSLESGSVYTGSILIDELYFGNMQIVVGILSCEDEGLVDCGDDVCAETFEDCSCESQGLYDCLDGSCAETLEDCSCESQGLVECEDGSCVDNEQECGDLSNEIPDEFSISKPYPNPFNPTVKLDFSLPSLTHVDINIYDINGAHVQRLMDEVKSAGYYSVSWNASHLSAGMYFIQFSSEQGIETMKVLLIK